MEALPSPLLIAMDDDSRSRELAGFIKCPLISQTDISRSFPNSTQTQLFEAVSQVASTQLSLNLTVVVNSTFSRSSHLDKLMHVVDSENARFVILEWETQDDKVDKFGVGRILRLGVAKESFDVKKVVSDISLLLSDMERDEAVKGSESHDVNANEKKVIRQPINEHLHVLTLLEKPRKDELTCKSCSEHLSGSSYHCVECDEFILHKSCAESAPNVELCPPFLQAKKLDQYDYDFKETHQCGICEEFSHDCYDCLLQTHLKHRFLPTILYRKQHDHFLNFIIMPSKYNYQYLCRICHKLGGSVSYKCFKCYYDVHVNCILPSIIRSDEFTFHLRYCGVERKNCYNCLKEIDSGELFYEGHDSRIAVHSSCMSDGSLPCNVQEKLRKKLSEYKTSIITFDWGAMLAFADEHRKRLEVVSEEPRIRDAPDLISKVKKR